jgi:predicted ATPase
MQRSANTEAVRHVNAALEVLKTLPNTSARLQQELRLQIALSVLTALLQGYGAPDVENAYTRARELCQQLGAAPQLVSVLLAMHRFYAVRAELTSSLDMAEQALAVAQSTQDPALLLQGHIGLGAALLWYGHLRSAHEHQEQGLVLYHPQEHHVLALSYGEDFGVVGLSFHALTQWCLGHPDQALKSVREALILAQSLSHPISIAVACSHATLVHYLRREEYLAQEQLAEFQTLSDKQGFPHWSAIGEIFQGMWLTEQQQREAALAQIESSLEVLRAMGIGLWRPMYLTFLAVAYGKDGQVKKGLLVLAEAVSLAQRTGDRMWEAEIHRLQGELTLQQWKVESGKSPTPSI